MDLFDRMKLSICLIFSIPHLGEFYAIVFFHHLSARKEFLMVNERALNYLYSLLEISQKKTNEASEFCNIELKTDRPISLCGHNCLITLTQSKQDLRIKASIQNQISRVHFDGDKLTFELPAFKKLLNVRLEVPHNAFSAYLSMTFAPETFTRSEVRTLMQFLADADLALAAKNDHVSLETKKSHYKSAAVKMGVKKQARLVSTLLTGILLELSYTDITSQHELNDCTFSEYARKYLPAGVRKLILVDQFKRHHRVLDMGNLSGRPLIILQSMVLPDFQQSDLEYLQDVGLRLLWPLHHGALSPSDPLLTKDQQFQYCSDGVELLREMFCGDKVTLVSLVTSAWYGSHYAQLYPKRIKSLIFVAACYRHRPHKYGPQRIGDGLASLASRNDFIIDKILRIAIHHFRKPERFISMMRQKYANSAPDTAIINREFADQHSIDNGGRFYYMLSNSPSAISHDFKNGYNIAWQDLTQFEKLTHFIHGTDDVHTELTDIEKLIHENLPNATLHPIQECGELMYYNHFKTLIDTLKEI